MSNDLKKHFCPRLIDFVIIVGCKEPATPSQLLAKHLSQIENNGQFRRSQSANGTSSSPPLAQMPELLRRYPLDDHNDFMLPQDVTYFCQPEGCTNINCSNQQKANANRDTTSFIFSLTEKDSARVRYGVCINFFRPIEKKYTSNSNSKRNSINKQSSLDMKKVDTDEEEDELRNKLVKSRLDDMKSDYSLSQRKKRSKKASDVKYTHTLTSLCIISHHPFFSLFRECLNILRRIIEACHARSLASKPGTPCSSTANTPTIGINNKINRDTVWGILTGSSGTISFEQISSLVACEIREIETWILRLLSAPVPLPGKTKLIVSISLIIISNNKLKIFIRNFFKD
jgi:hypothetical protein